MMRDITIGQYYPADSILHRLDPRVKFVSTLVYIVSLFVFSSWLGYGVAALFLVAMIVLSKVPFGFMIKGLKPIMVLLLITMFFNLVFTPGEVLWSFWILKITKEGIRLAIKMGIRLVFLIIGASIMTLTTTPNQLTDGLERLLRPLNKIHVPVHEIAMMMSIALRFIPILMEETDKIMKAQMARGADFETGNLIQKVKNAFALMEREQKNLQLLKQSRPLLIEKFFRDITHRSRQEASYRLKPYLNYLNLKLDYDFYNVVILELENAQSLRDSYGIEKFQMELLNLRDLITEQTSELNYIYPLQDIDGYLCVIGQSGCQSGNFRQLTYKIISALVDNCNSQGLVLNAGIGAIVQDLWDLNRSYESAVHALDYRFFFPHQNVFDGREALGHDLSATDFSDSREEELIRLLCKKDVSAIDSWFQDFSRWLTENFRTKSFAFIQIYSLLGRILKFFYELNLDTHDLEAKILYVYNHLEEFHTTEELCGWLNELCRLLCRKLDSSLNDYHQKLCESVTSYIDENYASNTLCLNDIASEANVSPAYLSALFKKKQGVSISDYITTQRINAACRYLTATNMTLKEISMKCGYANQYYFSTSFKKKMNVTPSAYRDTQTSKS